MNPLMHQWLTNLSKNSDVVNPYKSAQKRNLANEIAFNGRVRAQNILNEHRGDPFADMSDKDFEAWVRGNPGAEEAARRLRTEAQTERDKNMGERMRSAQQNAANRDATNSSSPRTPAQDTVTNEPMSTASKVNRAANATLLGGFGVLGAADLPKSIENVSSGEADKAAHGTYGYTRLGSGQKFDKTTGQYVQMSPEELKARSSALWKMDYGKLVGDATMATSAAGTLGPSATSTIVNNASKIPGLNAEDIAKIKSIPGLQQTGKVVNTVGEVASRVFPAAVAFSKYGEMEQHMVNKQPEKAAKSGLEGAYWAAEVPFVGNKVSSVGIGHELFGSGARNLYQRYEQGKLADPWTALDATNIALGTYLTQKPYIDAGMKAMKDVGKAATETATRSAGKAIVKTTAEIVAKDASEAALKAAGEAGVKAFAKGALKQVPFLGAAVALPFAGLRAWEGDWTGAGLELAGAIPGAGLIAQGALAVRDVNKAMEDAENEEAKRYRQQYQQNKANKTQQAPGTVQESIFESVMRTGLQQRGL